MSFIIVSSRRRSGGSWRIPSWSKASVPKSKLLKSPNNGTGTREPKDILGKGRRAAKARANRSPAVVETTSRLVANTVPAETKTLEVRPRNAPTASFIRANSTIVARSSVSGGMGRIVTCRACALELRPSDHVTSSTGPHETARWHASCYSATQSDSNAETCVLCGFRVSSYGAIRVFGLRGPIHPGCKGVRPTTSSLRPENTLCAKCTLPVDASRLVGRARDNRAYWLHQVCLTDQGVR